MIMHNRQWSTQSDYIKHLPQYKWHTSKCCAVPEDPPSFFEYFFEQQKGWGLATYEQDWMDKEYYGVDALQENLTLADEWLYGMAYGAGKANITIQYCMPLAHQVLASSAHQEVTNIRATGDYFHTTGYHNWAIGSTGMMIYALGALPFKDGFYSSNLPQKGGQTEGPETSPDREALMATLSCAMVGPMDGIHLLNASRVLQACRSDGYILKPDRPVYPAEGCFDKGKDPFTCYTYQTYSDVAGLPARLYYHYEDSDAQPLTRASFAAAAHEAEEEAEEAAVEYLVYNWYTRSVTPLSSTPTVAPGYEGHSYSVVTPLLVGGTWAYVGEVDKFVTASTFRTASVKQGVGGLTVSLKGVAHESATICAAHGGGSVAWQLVCKAATFGPAGTSEVVFGAR